MRCIFVGIEYVGKSTLIELLHSYYQHLKINTHLDDHFTIPDASLSPASRDVLVGLPDDIKERMQRMQIQYHVDVIKNYPNTLISGWHIEEAIYSAMYGTDPESPYYGNYHYGFQRLYESQVLEAHLPDIVLVHMIASDAAISERMHDFPHQYQIIQEKDISEIKQRFEEEVNKSLFTQKGRRIVLDTTGKSPQESLDELLEQTEPLITIGELAIRSLPVPDRDYRVEYKNGVRQIIPD